MASLLQRHGLYPIAASFALQALHAGAKLVAKSDGKDRRTGQQGE